MHGELTLGEVFEDIAERLALARTKALMGEREEALSVFRGASLEYRRFREVLADYPGFHALKHSFEVTLATLEEEREMPLPITQPDARPARARKRVRKAA